LWVKADYHRTHDSHSDTNQQRRPRGHSADFDSAFLEHALAKAGMPPLANAVFDSLLLALRGMIQSSPWASLAGARPVIMVGSVFGTMMTSATCTMRNRTTPAMPRKWITRATSKPPNSQVSS